MHHKKLAHMRDTLTCAIETQLCDLGAADTKELGEAIDMIKDLEEAIYYCTVTEAMKHQGSEMELEMKKGNGERMYYDGYRYPIYYDDRRRREDGTFYNDGRSSYNDGRGTTYNDGGQTSSTYSDSNGMSYNSMMRDMREGRSPMSRKMYMEAKEMRRDKAAQLRELEKYMQELSQDITEMIADASVEEKQYLEKKITALASKIGQMK